MTHAFHTLGILAKAPDERLNATLEALVGHLHARGLEILLDQASVPDLPFLRDFPRADRDELGRRSDLVIAVGGDGTLINAAHGLAPFGKPVLGINLGRLGFLVDISSDELGSRLDRILAGEYLAEERFMLHGRVLRGEEVVQEGIVFNDLVYKVRDAVRMIEFDTSIDGRYLFTQRSDGMVICTPSGSTAYALSAGGPILTPSVEAIVLAPICPHTLSIRPIVVPASSTVEIKASQHSRANSLVSFDGQTLIDMEAEDRLVISRASHYARLIHPSDYDYFHILRAKLHWGGHP